MKRFIKWFYPYLMDSIAFMFYDAGFMAALLYFHSNIARLIIAVIWIVVTVYQGGKSK